MKKKKNQVRFVQKNKNKNKNREHCMARHGMSLVSWSCRGIQTWLSPTSLQYPLWHFLWCEWGRIHSDPTEEVYCFCLRRLIQRPRLRTRLMLSLCQRPAPSGDTCLAIGKTWAVKLQDSFRGNNFLLLIFVAVLVVLFFVFFSYIFIHYT